MNIIKYIFSGSYRKHRWAGKHLPLYRALPVLLIAHQIRKKPPIMWGLVEAQYNCDANKAMLKLVEIPKFKEVINE